MQRGYREPTERKTNPSPSVSDTSAMKTRIWAPAAAAVVLSLSAGCSPAIGGSYPGSGPQVQQDRDVTEFSSVRLEGAFDAQLSIGSPRKVTLEGAFDSVSEIDVKVDRDGELVVRMPPKFKSLRGIRVSIVAPALTGVEVDGATILAIDGLRGPSFDLEVNGATMARLDGEVDALMAELNGAAELDSTELIAQSVDVAVNGAGKADVTALAHLEAEINGAGRVRYRGTPTVDKAVHGAGRVRPF